MCASGGSIGPLGTAVRFIEALPLPATVSRVTDILRGPTIVFMEIVDHCPNLLRFDADVRDLSKAVRIPLSMSRIQSIILLQLPRPITFGLLRALEGLAE